jgi:predicted DNA-binding antitoxin AbrB/MazE fold protein
MQIEVEAVYEDGVLRLDKPLPLKEHERVTVRVKPQTSRIRQSAGLLRWSGDPEILRKIAENAEFGISESP